MTQPGDQQLRQQLDQTLKERDRHATKNEQLQAYIFEQESRIAEQEKFIRTQLQQLSRNPNQAASGQLYLVQKEREIMQLSQKLRYAQTQLEMVKAERPRVSEAFRQSHCEESSQYMSKTDLEDTPGPEDLDALRFLQEERSRLAEELERYKLENQRVSELYYKILAEYQVTKQQNEQLTSANAEISQILVALDSYVKDKSLLDSKLQKISEDYNTLMKKNAVQQAQLAVEAEKAYKAVREAEQLAEKLEKKSHQHATLEQGYFELDKEYYAVLKRLRAAEDELSSLRQKLADCTSQHEKDVVKIEMLYRQNAEYLEAIKHDLSEVYTRNDQPYKQSGIEMLEEYHTMVRELREYLTAKDVLLERLSVSHTSHARETTPSPNASAVNEEELHQIIYEQFVQIYQLTADLESARSQRFDAEDTTTAYEVVGLMPKLRLLVEQQVVELQRDLDRLHAEVMQRLGRIGAYVEYVGVSVLDKQQTTNQIVTDNMRLSRGFEHLMTDNETQVSAIFEHVEQIAGAVRSLCPSFSLSGANVKLPAISQSIASAISLEDVRGNLEQIQEVLQRMAALQQPNAPTYQSYDELLASALALTAQRNDLQYETQALKQEIERYKQDLKEAYLKYLQYDYQQTDLEQRLQADDLRELQTALEKAERQQRDFYHALEIKAQECALLESELQKLKVSRSSEHSKQSVALQKQQQGSEESISRSIYVEEQASAVDAQEDVAQTSAVHQDIVQSHALTLYYQQIAILLKRLSQDIAETTHFAALNGLQKRIYQIELLCKPVQAKLAMVDKQLIDLISAYIHYNFATLQSNDMGYKEILDEQKQANYRLLQLQQYLMEYLSQKSPQEQFDISLCMSYLQEIQEDKDYIVEKLKKQLYDKIEYVEQLSGDKVSIAENVRRLEEQLRVAEIAAKEADYKAAKASAELADSAVAAERMQKGLERRLNDMLEKNSQAETRCLQLQNRAYSVEAYNAYLTASRDEIYRQHKYLSGQLFDTEQCKLSLQNRLEELLAREAYDATRLNDALNELAAKNSHIAYLQAQLLDQHDQELEQGIASATTDIYGKIRALEEEKGGLEEQVRQLQTRASDNEKYIAATQQFQAERISEFEKNAALREMELLYQKNLLDEKVQQLAYAMEKLNEYSKYALEAEKVQEGFAAEKQRMEEQISALKVSAAELYQERLNLAKATAESVVLKQMLEAQSTQLTEKQLEIDGLKRDIQSSGAKAAQLYIAAYLYQQQEEKRLLEKAADEKTISDLKERIEQLNEQTADSRGLAEKRQTDIEQLTIEKDYLKQQVEYLYKRSQAIGKLDVIAHALRLGEGLLSDMFADRRLADALTAKVPQIVEKLDSAVASASIAYYSFSGQLFSAREEARNARLESERQYEEAFCPSGNINEAFLAHELKLDEIKGAYDGLTNILRQMHEYLQRAFSESAAYLSDGFSAVAAINSAVGALLEELQTRESPLSSIGERCNTIFERISSSESGLQRLYELLQKHATECAYSMYLFNDVKLGGKNCGEDIQMLYSAVNKIDAKMDGYFYSEHVIQLRDILAAIQKQNSLSASDTPQSLHGNSLSISSPVAFYNNAMSGYVNAPNSLGYDYLSQGGNYAQRSEHFYQQIDAFSQIQQPYLPPTQLSYNMASGMEIGRLNLRIGQLEAYLVYLQGAKTAATAQSEEFLRRENSRLESDLKHTLLEYDLLRKQITEYKLQIQAYEMTLGEQREEILALRGTGQKYDALCRQKDLQDEQLQGLRAAFSEIRALVQAHFGDNRDIIQYIENLLAAKRQIIDLEAKIVDLESRLRAADEERKSFRRRAREERDQKERMQRAVKQLELKVERQNQQLEKYRDDVREIRQYAQEYASAVQEELKSRIG